MKCINAICIFVLLAVFIFSAGMSSAAPDLKSAKPRYASILLPGTNSKAMTVIFDESQGTGKGYDTVYVDADLDGEFESNEKISSDYAGSENIYSNNMFLAINIPSLTVKGKSKCFISLQSIKFYDKEEIFPVRLTSVKYVHNKAYEYLFYGELNPSIDINKPFVWNIGNAPSIELDAKPDAENTGIALSFNIGDANIYSLNVKVDLIIKDSSGKIVKKETGNLDKFAFG